MTDPLATHAPKDFGVPAFARDFSVSGHVVVVTGAGQGIGREFARQFAAAGAVPIIADLNLENAKTVAADRFNWRAEPLSRSPSTLLTRRRSIRWLPRRSGNSGALTRSSTTPPSSQPCRSAPSTRIPLAEWETVMKVTITGVFLCACAVAQTMRDRGFGRIVNISSDSVHRGTINYLHYVTSKAAVIGMTNSLARELGPYGITVNAVRPGSVATEVERAVNPTAEVRKRNAGSSVHPARHGAHGSRRARDVPHDLRFLIHYRPDHRMRRRLHAQLLTFGRPEGPK